MTKHIEKPESKASTTSWSKFNHWLNSLVQVLDYDPLVDTRHNAEISQKEILKLEKRVHELECAKQL